MDAETLVGKVFGDCLLQGLIGAGTMGVTYRAMQSHPLRQVAVKVMTRTTTLEVQQQAAFQEMFRGVMARVESLRHRHIVPVYASGFSDDGLAYVVMADIQGETLEQALAARGALALPQALRYLEQIAEALDYAHTRGIVHRDVKPATIFLSADEQALVADFLLTSALADEAIAPMRLSCAGMLDYMSPELVVGKEVDGRADIYSLGALLYHMVTGQAPFQGQTLMKVAAKHLKATPPSPSALRPDLPVAAEQVILKALEKRPAHRYDSAHDLARSFRRAVLGEHVQVAQ
ncbi:MAG TPA: serine/threonine-protein kinase, partial [Ktedonobacteraceae bacterium]|nr:serine/threonine-protein kinase [Ktedonobacteraceae bacterium]